MQIVKIIYANAMPPTINHKISVNYLLGGCNNTNNSMELLVANDGYG